MMCYNHTFAVSVYKTLVPVLDARHNVCYNHTVAVSVYRTLVSVLDARHYDVL